RRGDDGWSRTRLRGSDDREIVIGMGPGFRTWQVCTGDDLESDRARQAIAIEPMTCPPNAFASGTEGDDFDVVEPGGRLAVEWSVSLLPDRAGCDVASSLLPRRPPTVLAKGCPDQLRIQADCQ